MSSAPPRIADANRRSVWGHVVLVCAVAVQLLAFSEYVRFFETPSVGFIVTGVSLAHDSFDAVPVTGAAAEAAPSGPGFTRISAINGRRLADLPAGQPLGAAVRALFRRGPGAVNEYVLATPDGPRTVAIPLALPSFGVWLTLTYLVTHLVGIVYLLSGLLVWWKRHTDRAALPLLTFSALTSVQLVNPAAEVWFDNSLALIALPLLPLYATAGFQLALAFTGFHQHAHARLASCIVMGVSALLAVELLVAHVAVVHGDLAWQPLLHRGLMVTGVHLLVALVGMVGICWRAMRPPHPLGLRRRAAVLGWATLIAFSIPSAYLAIAPVSPAWLQGAMSLVMPLTMGTFPVFLGYAIVRHQMFDLRIVIRQGVVYGALSLVVTLVYLGVVLFGVGVVGRHAENPVFIALLAGTLVLVASLLKLQVQQAVDRLVFRTRYVYAEAVSRASAALARARSIEAIVDTMRVALIESMQLTRAYVALGDGTGDGRLQALALGSPPDPSAGVTLPELPRDLEAARFAPIERVLTTRLAATAYDSRAASAQATGTLARARADALLTLVAGVVDQPHGEDTFWARFGIEEIVPVRVGFARSDDRVVGLLILGPRRDERPFDREDERLLATLVNQLAVALENARAFEEIERLKAGLEAEVLDRTRELREALDHLSRAQATLLESQKQALLGRLVAGIVHEVNSPLGAVRSAADTIRRSVERARSHVAACLPRDPSAERALRALASSEELTSVIESGCERIGALATSLAAFVSLDQTELRRVDIRLGLESALTLLGPRLGRGIVLERAFAEVELPVRCSPTRLNQVFLNLLENAITAVAPAGRVKVEAYDEDRWIVVAITDDGPGIPDEQLLRVFDFSFTTKGIGRVGLGLGLPASRRVVEELGGTLTLAPAANRGTIACVSLPRAIDGASAPPAPPA
ncbi:MAG: GAF domain-containing protein [Polyangiaceae bacterium]|nr:GAF domain-containing protein [Polyangiaceae bacterium]